MGAATPALGVPQLDALVAPIPAKTALLYVSDPGVESEPFLYQAAHGHWAQGRPVVYLTTTRTPKSVLEDMEAYGFPPGDAPLTILDAYSGLLGLADDTPTSVRDPRDLTALAACVRDAARERPDALLVVDSLSALIDSTSPERFLAAFPDLHNAIRAFPFSTTLFTRWPYPDEVRMAFDRFDAVVHLGGVEERILFGQYFQVRRAPWRHKVDEKPRLFKALRPGGVVAYIPKILVTGPPHAGKSTFLRTACDTARSVDRMGTTVALDHGQAHIDGVQADVFGTPGQERFDPILRTLAAQALGVVVLVDASRPETFDRALEMMELTWKEGLPAIVAANKQDLAGALTPAEVGRRMRLPKDVPVFACQANDRAAAKEVLHAIIDRILAKGVEV